MTLNKIANFAETRDAKAFAKAITARLEGALAAQLVHAPVAAPAPVLSA